MLRCFAVSVLTISAIEVDHADENGCALQVRDAAMELTETASQSVDSSRAEITDEMRAAAPPTHNSPVKDAGGCGSCWAYSATEGIETADFGLWLVADGDEFGDLPTAFDYVEGGDSLDTYADTRSKAMSNNQDLGAKVVAPFQYFGYPLELLPEASPQCTIWLADKAEAYDEFKVFRQQMAAHGYQRAIPNSVKIGAYCPAIIADTTLTFLHTPCEDRNRVLRECAKGLKETCKFRRGALKRMMNFVNREFQKAKRRLPKKQKRLFQSNWNALKQPIAHAINFVNCNTNINDLTADLSADSFRYNTNSNDLADSFRYNTNSNDLTADSFQELQKEFGDGLRALDSAMGFTQRRK